MAHDEAVDREALESALATVFAPFVRGLGLSLQEVRAGEVTLHLPVSPQLVHGGGVLCGQAIMAAADSAMVLAVMTRLGGFRPMTTVQLQTSFLKPVPGDAGHASVQARVLRLGRTLAFGEVLVRARDGGLAAHATTTYALL